MAYSVLIIEDNPSMAGLEKRYLEKDGFLVQTAPTGQDGLELLSKGDTPHILIIDYKLPDMSGVEVMQAVKDQGMNVPTIIVTAAGNEAVAVSAMKLGAMDYIVKDVETIKHLPETCREVIKRFNLEKENQKLVDELKQVNNDLVSANMKLDELSKRDDLTGIANRRYMMESLEYEITRSRRYRTPLSFVLFDLDYFKNINDTFGHATGDIVLKQFAATLQERLRKTDVLGRYGGEEFGIVLTETDLESAICLCEEMRELVAKSSFGFEHSPINITTSAGISVFTDVMDRAAFIEKADKGLYEAKNSGRNRIVALQKED